MPRRELATKNKALIASVYAILIDTNPNFIASVNLTPAKTHQNNNLARFSERDYLDHNGPGDVIRRLWPRLVDVPDLPNLFQPVSQPGKTLHETTGAEALCQ